MSTDTSGSGIFGWLQKNPLLGGLAIGAGTQLLGTLLTTMTQPSAPSDSGATSPYGTGVCTTQYYYTSDPNATMSDPCALYNPSSSGGQNTATNGTDISSLLNGLGTPTGGIDLGTTPTSSISDILNNQPGNCPSITVLPNCPDGYQIQSGGTDSKGCSLQPTCVIATSTIAITNPIDTGGTQGAGTPVGGDNTDGGDTGTIGTDVPVAQPISEVLTSTVYYDDTTGPDTPDPSQTPLNQANPPIPQNGIHGDLLSFGGGATIYANSRNGNTEVAGFFGSNSSPGALCQSRPWSKNFLSYIIPPGFFDQICSWAGYPVGAIDQSGGVGGAGAPTTNNTSVGAPQTQQSPYINPTLPQAKIWARPASVSIGGRTTIFWTSQNVSACTESSSDGNFTGSSTSGGASTVALSGPVTFMIECRTVDNQQVKDQFTVQIGI